MSIQRGFSKNAAGSALITAGGTSILCTANWIESLPGWLHSAGHGWLTAEYSMLPGSTKQRKPREGRSGRVDGRSFEIQRFIGRSLRASVDVKLLPELSIWVDCDVISADGGTRTLAVTGAYVATFDALRILEGRNRLRAWPIKTPVAAVSVGLVGGEARLDLCYEEDSAADVDMNVVYTGQARFAELQATAEGGSLDRSELGDLLDLAEKGCKELLQIQEQVLGQQ